MSEENINSRPLNERMAIVETQIDILAADVKGIKDEISSLTKAAWGVMFAIAAWALVQLYVGMQSNIQKDFESRPAVAASSR